MARDCTSRRRFLALTGAGLAWPCLGLAGDNEVLSGRAFGTGWSLAGPAGIGALGDDISRLFAEIDREMSPWRSDSAISRFNRGGAGISAGSELGRVTAAALRLARASGGAFDPTVGPLVARWGFGPIAGRGLPDWRGLSIRPNGITRAQDGLTLDLCGIAKGRALDLAVALVRARGIRDFLFDLGGELSAVGRHPSGRSWRVGIEDPRGGGPVAGLRLVDGMSVATSGLARQSYLRGGRRWGHIIDPDTAEPVEGALRAVTVLARDAMSADGWATALFAAGDRGGPLLARHHGLAALFLFEEDGALRRVVTGGIASTLMWEAPT